MNPKPFANPKLFLLFLVFLIFFFSFLTYWRFKEFKNSFSRIEPPKLELPKTELFPQPKIEEKEFTSPDGKLKFKYGSDWREMGGDGGLLDFSKQQVEGAKILFFAQKLSEANVGFLSVQEMEAAPEQTLEEIINKIKGGATTSETEIVNLDLKDNEAIFDADYKKETISIFHSKDKIIRNENKAYIVSILAFSEGWASIEPDANKIIDSVQILENK